MRIPLIFIVLLVTASSPAATFSIVHFGTPIQAQPAIEHAAGVWGGILVSDVPIKVSVSWTALGGSSLGVTFPNGRKDFPGAPVDSTWYPTALVNSINQAELNPGEDDINVYLNSSTNWYLGLDGDPPAGQYDLVSVFLHELGHGLGFLGLTKKEGAEGSFGAIQASDIAPLTTTFPWPELDTLPGIFDRFLQAQDLTMLTDVANPSNTLGSLFTSGQLRWNGTNGLIASGGAVIRIYSPSPYESGSSCVHLNEATYPNGNPNELMTPHVSPGQSNHWPGPIVIGVMRDIGWVVDPNVGLLEHHAPASCGVWPNPVDDHLRISCPMTDELLITDLSGRSSVLIRSSDSWDVSQLQPGSYFILGLNGPPLRFIKQ
ncbi:MAG: T9SS type A sorting domain-containing protein [Flavobacteriales bacterium]|nr:T9SS type A sorting domain-containing protein [Flavobacteriales bacterium]